MNQKTQLKIKSEKYRSYVRAVADPEIAQSILRLALELEQQAMQVDEEDIRTRAYELWTKAGEPDCRDEEFWHRAEHELRDEG